MTEAAPVVQAAAQQAAGNSNKMTEGTPIVKTGAGQAMTPEDWDDLDQVTSATRAKKSDKPKTEKKDESDDEEEEKPEKKTGKGDSDDADDEEEVKEVKEDKKTKESTKEEVEKEAKEAKKASKVYKAKIGDTELDISSDAVLKHKVGGQDVDVTVQELLNNYAGKTDWTRKYSDLDREKKSFYAERESLTSKLSEVFQAAGESGDARAAVEIIAEMVGADPLETWNNLTQLVESRVTKFKDLSPEQIELEKVRQENEYFKRRTEAERAKTAKAKEMEAVKAHVEKLRQAAGIDEQKFAELYSELAAEVKSGAIDAKELTPELVIEYHEQTQRVEKVQSLLSSLIGSEVDTSKEATMLLDVWAKNKEFTLNDIAEIAQEVYGKRGPKSGLAKKVAKTHKEPAPLNPRSEPMFFDDL